MPIIIATGRPNRSAIAWQMVVFNKTPMRVASCTIAIIKTHATINTQMAEYCSLAPICELIKMLPGPHTTAATMIAGPDFARIDLLE